MRGSRTSDNFSQSFPILALLFGIALAIFIFLKNKTSSNSVPLMSAANSSDFASIINQTLTLLGMNSEIAGYVTAQSAFETNNFNSPLFMNYNNAFGMTFANQPNASGQVKAGNYIYAVYNTVQDSVKDLKRWYDSNRLSHFLNPLFINSLSDYVAFLKQCNYFESDEAAYLAGCQRYYDLYFQK